MAGIFNDDESTDDEIGVNLQLAERLRINRENCKLLEHTSLEDGKDFKQLCNMHRKNFSQKGHSSSSSSIEIQSDNAASGITSSDNYHNKKRQNGDKNIEQLANPKRTCLSDRFRRSPEYRDRDIKKKRSNNEPHSKHSKLSDHLQVESVSSPDLMKNPNKKGEEHVNGLADAEDSDFEMPTKVTRNCKKNGHGSKSHKNHCPLSTETNLVTNYESKPSTSYFSRILDNSSEDESKTFMQNGALKGGRPESSDHTYHIKRLFGRKVNKKVLDSDESEEDHSREIYRSRPLVFSSSDSERELKQTKSPNKHAGISSSATPNHSLPYGDGHRNPRNYKSYRPKKHSIHSPRRADSSDGCDRQFLSSDFKSKTPPGRAYRTHRSPRMNIAANLASNTFPNGNNMSTPVRGGDRGSRRSGSPRHRNPHSRHRSDNSKCRGRSASSSHSHNDETNYVARYPDVFDAEESENEFFTANSYSDTETSTESLGGVTINASFPSHRGTISCSIDCEGDGSTDDEIRVVFSTGPYGRNNETRRGSTSRTLGRRYHRGSTPCRQPHEVVSLSPDPVEQVRQVEEDEIMARMLQAQFDAEVDTDYRPPPSLNFPVEPQVESDDDDVIDPVGDSDSEGVLNFDHRFMDFLSPARFQMTHFANRPGTPNSIPPVLFGGNTRRYGSRNRRRVQFPPRESTDIRIARFFGLGIPDLFGGGDEYETLLRLDVDGEVIPRGLHKSDINRLPTRKYVHPNSASSSTSTEGMHKRTELNKECQVCLSDYETGDILRILPCFHEFHTPCIDPWLKINHTCPVCRVAVDLEL